MAQLPQQPDAKERSLQINIDSEDDAKAVIQHLPKIKSMYDMLHDAVGIESVEFCIADALRNRVDSILLKAIRWCRTYIKYVKPFEGNVLFPLPHYVDVQPPTKTIVASEPPGEQMPAQSGSPPLGQSVKSGPPFDMLSTPVTLGKTKRPVRADQAGG